MVRGSRGGEGSRGGGDVRRVVYREEEGGGEVCDSKHYISGPSFSYSFNRLNCKDGPLRSSDQKAFPAHCVSLSKSSTYCTCRRVVVMEQGGGGGGRGRGGVRRCWGAR